VRVAGPAKAELAFAKPEADGRIRRRGEAFGRLQQELEALQAHLGIARSGRGQARPPTLRVIRGVDTVLVCQAAGELDREGAIWLGGGGHRLARRGVDHVDARARGHCAPLTRDGNTACRGG
jgi:hypothetical protein